MTNGENGKTANGIRRFTYEDGRTIEMTEEEFDRLVDYFRILERWDSEQRKATESTADRPTPISRPISNRS